MRNPESEFPGESLPQYLRLESVPVPRDRWRVLEDRAATTGQTLSAKFREKVRVDPRALGGWFDSFQLSRIGEPLVAGLPDYSSAVDDRERAAAWLGRLAPLGKIHWVAEGSYPPDLRVRPSHLIAKGDKVRVVRDWSHTASALNSASANPPVQHGAMDAFLGLRPPGAYMGGIDWQDCSLGWLASPSCRRSLGVRHPVSGDLGVYLG